MTSNVFLIGTRFSDGSEAFRIEVGPENAQATVADITVLSGEAEGLFNYTLKRDDPSLAVDIKLLYRLSEAFDPDRRPVIGIQPIPQRSGGQGLSIHCPRALFVDNQSA